MTCDVEYFG